MLLYVFCLILFCEARLLFIRLGASSVTLRYRTQLIEGFRAQDGLRRG